MSPNLKDNNCFEPLLSSQSFDTLRFLISSANKSFSPDKYTWWRWLVRIYPTEFCPMIWDLGVFWVLGATMLKTPSDMNISFSQIQCAFYPLILPRDTAEVLWVYPQNTVFYSKTEMATLAMGEKTGIWHWPSGKNTVLSNSSKVSEILCFEGLDPIPFHSSEI